MLLVVEDATVLDPGPTPYDSLLLPNQGLACGFRVPSSLSTGAGASRNLHALAPSLLNLSVGIGARIILLSTCFQKASLQM